MTREAWIRAAICVSAGDRQKILCPEHEDDFLVIEWLSGGTGGAGEYWLRCPTCGAQNWIRTP